MTGSEEIVYEKVVNTKRGESIRYEKKCYEKMYEIAVYNK